MDAVHVPARPRRLGLGAVAIACAIVLAVALGPGRASAAPKMTVLGAAAPAAPACPQNCQAIGKMTGFQSKIGKTTNPFEVPYPGRLVAWSIKLSGPTQTQLAFFKDFYGGDPQARIAVLKPAGRGGAQTYTLKSQSPVEDLTAYLGTTTTFTLSAPLKVNTGQIIALTVPTWAPAFAINLPDDTIWRASRAAGKCMQATDIQAGTPQETVGQARAYGCQYKTARLLYSATVVRDPNAPNKKKPSGDQQQQQQPSQQRP